MSRTMLMAVGGAVAGLAVVAMLYFFVLGGGGEDAEAAALDGEVEPVPVAVQGKLGPHIVLADRVFTLVSPARDPRYVKLEIVIEFETFDEPWEHVLPRLRLCTRVRCRLRLPGRVPGAPARVRTGRDRKAALRRREWDRAAPVTVGNITLDPASRDVTVEGQKVKLRQREFDLLEAFLRHPNVALDRERLLSMVWGHDYFGDTRTIDVHVAWLRDKLGAGDARIETVWGVGYKLVPAEAA